jgi:hypothetical protein
MRIHPLLLVHTEKRSSKLIKKSRLCEVFSLSRHDSHSSTTNAAVTTTMTESTNRDEWLAQIEKSVEAKAEHLWKRERWSEFVKEVVWWLHNDEERDDADTIEAAVGLIVYGIREKQDLIRVAGNPPNNEAFNRKLEAKGVLPAICDILFDKYVAQQISTGVETIPEHMVPVLLRLAVSSMKSGWEKISSERTKSESSTARNNSVSYYGLHSRRTCQILGTPTAHVQNAHIWPHNNSEALVLVDLQPSDIDDARNVLRLHEDIEYYLDRFHLTLVVSGSDFVLKVLDSSILPLRLKDRTETFRDLDGCKLQCPSGSIPWRRLLGTHSILAHQKARDQAWLPEDQFSAAETNAEDLMAFSLDKEAQDRLKRFLNDKDSE